MKIVLCSVVAMSLCGLVTSKNHKNKRLHQRQHPAGTVEQSACNQAVDISACSHANDSLGHACQWCVSGAIPSECVSQSQAEMLPAGVFECSVPERTSDGTRAVFEFVPHKQHQLKLREVSGSDFCDPSSNSISGYMDITGSQYDQNNEDKHLFFWMFEKRGGANETTPFVVWLTGGPGCSSTLALLTENGPCSVNKDGKTTTVNPYAWTESANVLWLDQPASVGFSYGAATDMNEEMVAEDAYYFFQAFFQTYPQYLKNPLFIVGESYAGHYVPAISHRIYRGNKEAKEKTVPLNFAGLAIGNGLTSPEKQYPSYPEMVYNNSHKIKVVDEDLYKAMQAAVPKCTALIRKCNEGDGVFNDFACQSAFLVCNLALTSPYQATGLNPYDIRKQCEVPPLCYDFSHVSEFLNRPSTKQALHVDEKHSHAWESCNFGVNMKFHKDWMKDFSGYVAELLDAGFPTLIYVGDVDFICNYFGNEVWTYELDWSGKSAFQSTEMKEWKGAGLTRSAKNFVYLRVYDAGHMVPTDQPKVALDMITNFIQGGAF